MLAFLFAIATPTDEEIFKADAERAFRAYSKMVYKHAFLRTGNVSDAEDILSEVFVRLVKNTEKIKNEVHLKAWLIRATINCSNTYYKRSKRINQVRLTDVDAPEVNSENSVLSAVLALPIHQKTVVYMYYYEGYSVEEIANLCGVARGTVKSRLARARETLKSTLEGVDLDV
ncbi:MAG: RNA polymerase sigma factor [Ruminococcaceae bacterium]|nr:RNA polymerase sigma factor [Oscillospiraceae bacterium]